MIDAKKLPTVQIMKVRNGYLVFDMQTGETWALNFWAEAQRKAKALLDGEAEHY